jgi:predicted ATPase
MYHSLDRQITGLNAEIKPELREGLRGALRTLRDADHPMAVLANMSRLCLQLLTEAYQAAGSKRPSDNLYDCIVKLGRGEEKTKGLGILPDEKATYLQTIRVLSNKSDHAGEKSLLTTEDAETALKSFLIVLRWFYEECEIGPRLTTIFAENLLEDAPPPAPTPAPLPIQLDSFIGRQDELVDLKARLQTSRLVTLVGSGGTGKTRLAIQVGQQLQATYADGVVLVRLENPEISNVVQEVAEALQVKDQSGQPLLETLIEFLKPKTLLLLLDNCEHLIEDCARLVTRLLSTCPHLSILATSRELLRVAGEQVMWLSPLTAPNLQCLPGWEQLTEYQSVQLFVERARAKDQGFALTAENAVTVAKICASLEGIPLAIELAAARVSAGNVEKIAKYLDDPLRLLTGGGRDREPRQKTLEAAISWSYDLLSELEQMLLRRLAIFSGGWTTEAAESICSDDELDEFTAMDLLASLVDKSLVVVDGQEESRYRFLESIHQYSWQKLQATGELAALNHRHQDWFLQLAIAAEPELDSSRPEDWLNRLNLDHDNLQAAMGRNLADPQRLEQALRLGGALWQFWYIRGYLSTGRDWLQKILGASPGEADSAEKAKVLKGLGNLSSQQGDLPEAKGYHQQSLAIWQRLGEQTGVIDALNSLANIDFDLGKREQAEASYEQVLRLAEQLGDESRVADGFFGLGNIAYAKRDFELAKSRYEDCLSRWQQLGEKRRTLDVYSNLANVAFEQGDLATAFSRYEEQLATQRDLKNPAGAADLLHNLGLIEYLRANYDAARERFTECLNTWKSLQVRTGVASALHCLGVVAHAEQDLPRARQLLAESLVLWRQGGALAELAETLIDMAKVVRDQGELEAARGFYQEGLEAFGQLEEESGVTRCQEGLASLGTVDLGATP